MINLEFYFFILIFVKKNKYLLEYESGRVY